MFCHVQCILVSAILLPAWAFSQDQPQTDRQQIQPSSSQEEIRPQERVSLTILHTNDEHSHLVAHPVSDYHRQLDNPSTGGFARLATLVNRIRAEKSEAGEPVLLFSGGDIMGGPAFGWLALQGLAPELNLMKLIGYDGIVIGNHEFDNGPDILAGYLRTAGYPGASETTPVLGTNIFPPDDHPLAAAGIRRTMIRELENGLKVGVFGLIGDDAVSKVAKPGSVEFEDPIDTARKAVNELKQNGADLIISVNHSGVREDHRLAREVPGIDVIVGGHTHTPLYEPVKEGNTIIVQAGYYLRYLGMLELSWDPESREVTALNRENGNPFLLPLGSDVPADPDIADFVDFYENTLNQSVGEWTGGHITDIRQTIARADFPLERRPAMQETNLGNFITDALRTVTTDVLTRPVDATVQANGAIRSNIVPGTMEWSRGEISFYDMAMATGLGSGNDGNPGYPVVSFYLTEDEARRAMEISLLLSELLGENYFLQFSGVRLEYDPNRAILLNLPVTGTPIPTRRAVLNAELYTGSGLQGTEDAWIPLEKGSDRLLHVATDYYIATFLPLIGERVPELKIELKDRHGQPLKLDDAIVERNGEELKVWQAVVEYTLGLPAGTDGIPSIPAYYSTAGERLMVVTTPPLLLWPAAGLTTLFGLAIWLVFMRTSRKANPAKP